jgi:hypothetical protein
LRARFFVPADDQVAQPVDFALFGGARDDLQIGAGKLDRRLFIDAFFDEFDVRKHRQQRFPVRRGETGECPFFAFFPFFTRFAFFAFRPEFGQLVFRGARAFRRRHRRGIFSFRDAETHPAGGQRAAGADKQQPRCHANRQRHSPKGLERLHPATSPALEM